MKKHALYALMALLDNTMRLLDVGPGTHKFLLIPSLGRLREKLGKIRAARLFDYSRRRVPAYKDFVTKAGHAGPEVSFEHTDLSGIPETDKDSYVKAYPLKAKLKNGKLPVKGVMMDESSGSSGKPTSWVRSKREREIISRIMQVAFAEYIGKRQPIILNCFSMGAWATGFNTSVCLLGIGRVKSIGPDLVKVVDTMTELGPEFDYVILGYPPFLRQLAEQPELDFTQYHVVAMYGGEGMSESMRSHLCQSYQDVVGSYGASDLEINIAHETDFSVALRRELLTDEELRRELGLANRGILPMVFQYNPFDYVFETNAKGELLVTIARLDNLSPRIRYNIHDLGHVMPFHELREVLRRRGKKDLLKQAKFDFALLFHYGRSDLSVDYNGAVVGPEEVRQLLEAGEHAEAISTFRLISYEDAASHKHLMVALELVPDAELSPAEQEEVKEALLAGLSKNNLDFKSALRTAPLQPELRVYPRESGIFDAEHTKLKNDYIWNIDAKRAQEEGLLSA